MLHCFEVVLLILLVTGHLFLGINFIDPLAISLTETIIYSQFKNHDNKPQCSTLQLIFFCYLFCYFVTSF